MLSYFGVCLEGKSRVVFGKVGKCILSGAWQHQVHDTLLDSMYDNVYWKSFLFQGVYGKACIVYMIISVRIRMEIYTLGFVWHFINYFVLCMVIFEYV